MEGTPPAIPGAKQASGPPVPDPGPDAAAAAAETAVAPPRPVAGKVLRGTSVAPGLALGPIHRKDHDLTRASSQRVPLEDVERELNRFHRALVEARRQLADLKERLSGKVPVDDARILDVHVAYLKDSVFISDVENLILNEQMALEAAIAKVIADFDRIFRLVQNQTLRERAVDLRDVGLRVLRHLDHRSDDDVAASSAEHSHPPQPIDYVLASRELSIVDMFNVSNQRVLGILTEEGGMTSHAAILARSMRIPTITGIGKLLEQVGEGDFVIVDATEGVVRVNPDEVVLAQYRQAASETGAGEDADESLEWANADYRTLDGFKIHVSGACGNLPEVEQAVHFGMESIGLYRTELMYLIDKEPPSRESLVHHYGAVIQRARAGRVTFRLLHVDSSLGVTYLHPEREQNPSLGRAGVRALLGHEPILRRQLQSILLAGAGAEVRIAVPFVTDCGELRRVKEILFEERVELRKAGQEFQKDVELGVVLETPASMLGVRDLAAESDFLVVSLDGLLQYVLAADRENPALSSTFEILHPFVLRSLRKVCEVARDQGKPLSVFGVSAAQPQNAALLIGTGFTDFCIAAVQLRDFATELSKISLHTAQRSAQAVAKGSCQADNVSLVQRFRHGFAGR